MNFDLVDSERLFFGIERQWNEHHDTKTLHHVGDILTWYSSLWYTPYGGLYKAMCRYMGYIEPIIPPRIKDTNYIVVIYKRYET